jgi:hypothetical protein
MGRLVSGPRALTLSYLILVTSLIIPLVKGFNYTDLVIASGKASSLSRRGNHRERALSEQGRDWVPGALLLLAFRSHKFIDDPIQEGLGVALEPLYSRLGPAVLLLLGLQQLFQLLSVA